MPDPRPDPTAPDAASERATLPPTAPFAAEPSAASEPATLHTNPGAAPPPGIRVGTLPERFGRYQIQKKLGEGGMGAVYLAYDGQLARPVALKVPLLEGADAVLVRARFLQEARAAAALHHPNICPIHDLGEIDGVPYLTMPFLTGQPLAARVAPTQPLPPREAADLVRKTALALQAAHDQGVIHRDLKPGNILLDGRGEPIVMDFGLARRADLSAAPLTQQGQLMGTPAYMAPEQLSGDTAVMGPGCDIYSLGVVFFELLTGTTPFQGALFALVSQIALDPAPAPSARRPGLDPRLDALCLKALAKKPQDRWPTMQAFAAALADFLHGPPPAIAAPPPTPAHLAGARTDGPLLTLRVEGSPFVYRPAPGQDVVAVGRQKRGPADPPDHGNDLVLRVPGNDQLSARISRRHFEIRRVGADYCVTDLSRAGTLLNGQPLPRNTPTPLKAGDRLVVAGVVALEVLIQRDLAWGPSACVVQAPTLGQGRDAVVMEASVGDLATVE